MPGARAGHPTMNILHLESSGSWGGQEFRTCLEINWLNAHGHQAWMICDPKSEVFARAQELGTRVLAFPMRFRIDPLASLRIWNFCRRHQVELIKTYSSKDHWLCLPLFLTGMPVTRARCITDPLGNRSRGFIYKYGCAKIVADAKVIKKQLIEQNGIPPGENRSHRLGRRSPEIYARHRSDEVPPGDGFLQGNTTHRQYRHDPLRQRADASDESGPHRFGKASGGALRFCRPGHGRPLARKQTAPGDLRFRPGKQDHHARLSLGHAGDPGRGQHGGDRFHLHGGFAHRFARSLRHRPARHRHESGRRPRDRGGRRQRPDGRA